MNILIAMALAALFFSSTIYFAWAYRSVTAKQASEKERLEEMRAQVSGFQERVLALERENSRLESEKKNLIESLESEKSFLNKAKEDFKDAFRSLASNVLESSSKQFLELAETKLQKHSEIQKLDIDARQKAIDDMMKPVAQALQKYQEQISTMEKDRQRAFTSIDVELKRIIETSANLSRETTALKDALKKPHVRGRWGEVQLRNCIDLAGMSEFADVSFQSVLTEEDGVRHIPDMIVRMPGGRQVIVDAKTPIDAFLNSLEATTEDDRKAEMVRHGRHVKDHVKKLSSRSYNEAFKDSADFTVMFLPNESFLYAALEMEPDLVEFALQKKVLIATPPTLIGLLKVIRFGWSEEKLAENAQRISEIGQELHKRICDFVDAYVNVGKFLDKAKDEYEKGRARLESRVLVQARRFEALGVKSHKSLGLEEGQIGGDTAQRHPSEKQIESQASRETIGKT